MSKQYNIRWGRSDASRLSHLVRKANKKIFEIQVTRPDIADYQPEMLDYQTLKSQIKTRHDFNLIMRKYNRYLREGSEEIKKSDRGAVASKWEIKEFEISQRAENTRRRNERKRLGEEDVTIGGVKQASKRSQMGSILDNSFKESKKKFKNMSQNDWDRAFRNFDRKMFSSYKEEQQMLHMRNYVKGLIAEGYDDALIDMMKHVKFEDFRRVFHSDEIATIDFIYDPIELKLKQEALKDLWSQYIDDEIENDFGIDAIEDEIQYEYENGLRVKGVGRVKYVRQKRRPKKGW